MRLKKKTTPRAGRHSLAGARARVPPPRLSAERYHELLFALTEGVVMISSTGRVIAANPSAEAILGMTAKEMEQFATDDSVWHAVAEDGSAFPANEFPVRKTLHTGKPYKGVMIGIRPRGSRRTRWTRVSTQPVFGADSHKPAAVVVSFEDVTQLRRVAAERARLAAAIQASPDAITSADVSQRYISWNPGAERLFGYAAREVIGRRVGWMIPADRQAELRSIRDRVYAGETIIGWETERTHKDGHGIFVESSYAPIRDAQEQVTGIVGIHRDVSPIKRMLLQIESSKELFRLALNGIPDVFMIYDQDLRIQFVNERGTEFFARGSTEIVGKRHSDLLPPKVVQILHPPLVQACTVKTTQSQELAFKLHGRNFSVGATYVPMIDDNGNIRQILGLLHDVTQRRKQEERLSFMAQYDALTGLPNRYLLLDRMDAAMQRARRNNTLLGIMFLDVDRFKEINDTRGHAIGDVLLQQIADRLTGSLRATDTIARLGGDEFTVLVENAGGIDEITSIAEKIKSAFATAFDTELGEIFTTTSVGITVYPLDGNNRDELLKNADVAMYHAKQDRNTWVLYRSDMNAHADGRLRMEVELRHALVRNEFELHFQPQIDIKSGAVTGMEALLRWNNQRLGRVPPVQFIPLAEDTGLIVPIGEWILRATCEQCKAWEKAGLAPLPVSVNIAAPQFRRSNLLELVRTVLNEYALDARWLALEITESNIMRHAEQTIKTLLDLRELGISIAIDDFGTGYSSLSYLKRFPVNKIKIDRSFVNDIGTDPNDAAIVAAIIAMSRQLGIKTVAEGVETDAQLAFLAQLECDEYQGYYFSKPLPAAEVTPLLRGQPALQGRTSA